MSDSNATVSAGGCGCFGLGSAVATVLSCALNHSFWWAVLHFCFGWMYVLYAAIARSREIVPALRAMFGFALLLAVIGQAVNGALVP